MSKHVKISIAVWLVLGIAWFAWQRRSTSTLETIAVDDGTVTVRNQTPRDWQNVRIWVNEHYAGEARSIAAGSFVREPLSRFITAGNVTFDAARLKVNSVVVLAMEPDGTRVRVPWGKPVLH
jgi:hypothetical protein